MQQPTKTPMSVNELATLSAPALRELWTALRPRTRPPEGRRVIVRELAWSAQSKLLGDLDAETGRLLRAAIRGAKIEGGAAPSKKKPTRLPRAKLKVGTKLVREWGGSTHEVVVVEGARFGYRGMVYKSLTEIAKEITGAHWSGPRFFGLYRKAAKP